MDVTLLLCDFAEAVNGKLYVMGGGWNVLFAPGQPVTMSVAAVVAVAWDQTNRKHELALALLNEDGGSVEMEEETIEVTGEFELGRPPGIKPGSSLNAPFVWTFAGLVLEAGGYEWKLSIDGEPVASRPFAVTSPPGFVQE
jgi:Family of unknown function (DUF6941)